MKQAPSEYLVEGVLPRQGLGAGIGQSASGKGSSLHAVLSIRTGRNFFGRRSTKGARCHLRGRPRATALRLPSHHG
jgi:hypothetical protein